MKARSGVFETVFLQAIVVLIGIGAVAFLLWEPHVEGRNAGATPSDIYFNDPVLAYAYVASLSFFMTLYQTFTILRYARNNEIFTQAALRALRTMRRCSVAMVGFVVVGEVFLILPSADEPPQAIVMGLVIALVSAVIAATASVCARVVENAIERIPHGDGRE